MRPDEERIAWRGRLFDVAVERWGEHEREIVSHPGSVAIVAVDAAERVVLVRQRREAARAELVELPAGTLEAGEEPLACAQRELAEGTGLRGGSWRELASVWTAYGYSNQGFHVFLATDLEHGEQALSIEEADLRVAYLVVAEFREAVLGGRIKDAPTIAAFALLQLRNA